MIVLDASVAVELLLATPNLGRQAADEISAAGGALHGPHLLDAEVGQALRGFVLRGSLQQTRAVRAMSRLRTLALIRHPHTPFLMRAFELRQNTTFHDALYLALAERLGAQLLTADRSLAEVPGHRADVIVLKRR